MGIQPRFPVKTGRGWSQDKSSHQLRYAGLRVTGDQILGDVGESLVEPAHLRLASADQNVLVEVDQVLELVHQERAVGGHRLRRGDKHQVDHAAVTAGLFG